jgi:hypothetical protein
MQTLPLLSNIALQAVIAIGERPVTTAEFVAQAEALAQRLPDQP